jgi:hypothetical protein
MLYALLIYEAEAVSTGYTDAELEQALAGHRALQAEARRRGVFVEANQLMPAATASSVRVWENRPRITDGPFVETKELLIGYYVLDCCSLEEALGFASMIPHARTGGVEVRPVTYFERSGSNGTVWTNRG